MEFDRRSVLKISVAAVWASPVIQSVLLPAHAQTSVAPAATEQETRPDPEVLPEIDEQPDTSSPDTDPADESGEPPIKVVTPPAV